MPDDSLVDESLDCLKVTGAKCVGGDSVGGRVRMLGLPHRDEIAIAAQRAEPPGASEPPIRTQTQGTHFDYSKANRTQQANERRTGDGG